MAEQEKKDLTEIAEFAKKLQSLDANSEELPPQVFTKEVPIEMINDFATLGHYEPTKLAPGSKEPDTLEAPPIEAPSSDASPLEPPPSMEFNESPPTDQPSAFDFSETPPAELEAPAEDDPQASPLEEPQSSPQIGAMDEAGLAEFTMSKAGKFPVTPQAPGDGEGQSIFLEAPPTSEPSPSASFESVSGESVPGSEPPVELSSQQEVAVPEFPGESPFVAPPATPIELQAPDSPPLEFEPPPPQTSPETSPQTSPKTSKEETGFFDLDAAPPPPSSSAATSTNTQASQSQPSVREAEKTLPPLPLQSLSFGKVKTYADHTPIGTPVIESELPFSLLIEGPLTDNEKYRLITVLSRENMGIREIDLESQFASDRVLIPRISEYSGILLIQALRGVNAKMKFGPSDSIFSSHETKNDPELDTLSKPENKIYFRFDGSTPHPAELIPVTTDDQVREIPKFKILDVLTASEIFKSLNMATESSTEFQELVEALQKEIKFKAYRKGATAVIRFRVQTTPLPFSRNFRVLAIGSAIQQITDEPVKGIEAETVTTSPPPAAVEGTSSPDAPPSS